MESVQPDNIGVMDEDYLSRVEKYRKYINDAVVLDIGASYGGYSNACVQVGAKMVLAVEPDFRAVAHLMKVAEKSDGKIVPIVAAVTGEGGHLAVARSVGNIGQTSLSFSPSIPSVITGVVATITMQTLIQWFNFSVVKIDIEGGEWELMKSVDLKLFPNIKLVDIELHSAQHGFYGGSITDYDMRSHLEQQGFEVQGHLPSPQDQEFSGKLIAVRE
jgi:FkbM family methyltransferase